MELSPCPIFVDAEQCRSQINAFSYGFVSLVDIDQQLFVVKKYHHFFVVEGPVEDVAKVEPVEVKADYDLHIKGLQ